MGRVGRGLVRRAGLDVTGLDRDLTPLPEEATVPTYTFYRRDGAGNIVDEVGIVDLDDITPSHPVFAFASREAAEAIIDSARKGVPLEIPFEAAGISKVLARRGIRVETPEGGAVHPDGRITFVRTGSIQMPAGYSLGTGSICHDVTIYPDGSVTMGRVMGRLQT